jgi:hypothetical protein
MAYAKPKVLAREGASGSYSAACYQPTGMKCCECTH